MGRKRRTAYNTCDLCNKRFAERDGKVIEPRILIGMAGVWLHAAGDCLERYYQQQEAGDELRNNRPVPG